MLVTHLGRSMLGLFRFLLSLGPRLRRLPAWQRPPRPISTVRSSSCYLVHRQANVSNIGSVQSLSLPPSPIVLDPQAPPREYKLFRGSNSVFPALDRVSIRARGGPGSRGSRPLLGGALAGRQRGHVLQPLAQGHQGDTTTGRGW
jgi:hypothetical protein